MPCNRFDMTINGSLRHCWEVFRQHDEELDERPPSPCSLSGQSVGHRGSDDSGDVALYAQEAFMEEAHLGQTRVEFDSSKDEGKLIKHKLAQAIAAVTSKRQPLAPAILGNSETRVKQSGAVLPKAPPLVGAPRCALQPFGGGRVGRLASTALGVASTADLATVAASTSAAAPTDLPRCAISSRAVGESEESSLLAPPLSQQALRQGQQQCQGQTTR